MERILRMLARTPPGPLAAAIAVAALVFMSSAPDAAARVPSFRGMQVNPAIAKAAKAGYFAKVRFVEGGGVPGTVIGQSPLPLEIRDKGSEITLSVTEGQAQVRVPDVRGVHVDEARRRLDRGNVRPGAVIYRDDAGTTRDTVISTVPAPGKLVDVNTKVDLIAAD